MEREVERDKGENVGEKEGGVRERQAIETLTGIRQKTSQRPKAVARSLLHNQGKKDSAYHSFYLTSEELTYTYTDSRAEKTSKLLTQLEKGRQMNRERDS